MITSGFFRVSLRHWRYRLSTSFCRPDRRAILSVTCGVLTGWSRFGLGSLESHEVELSCSRSFWWMSRVIVDVITALNPPLCSQLRRDLTPDVNPCRFTTS